MTASSKRLLAIGATFVLLSILSLVLPLGAYAPPAAASYGTLTGGLLVMCVAALLPRTRRDH